MKKNRLSDIRTDLDLTQKEVAAHFNIAQNTYSQYETGKRDIPNDLLRQLAIFFNTSIDYILYMTDVSQSYPSSNIHV